MCVKLKVKVSCKLDWHRQGQVVNRPCVSFFIVTRGNYDVCQWANCHSETWQKLLQKITDIISRQGEWRRFFFSPTPDYLLSLKFIIKYQWGIFNSECATNITVTHTVDFDLGWPNIGMKLNPLNFMTRTEYELIYDAFKSHRYKMTDAQEVLSEKILDDLFYPHFDALSKPVE